MATKHRHAARRSRHRWRRDIGRGLAERCERCSITRRRIGGPSVWHWEYQLEPRGAWVHLKAVPLCIEEKP